MEPENLSYSPEPRKPRPFLILYSHARRPPLTPAPDLKYDLRGIPNPPKALRDGSDGRSKRLREHLLAEPKFVETLKAVESDILQAMQRKIEEWEGTNHQQENETQNSLADSDPKTDEEDRDPAPQVNPEDNDSSNNFKDSQTPSEDCEEENAIFLRVGCFCALGHHRSVAFIHSLAHVPWPKEWIIKVHHRDLSERRSGGTRERQKTKFRSHSREEANGWDMG